MARQNHGPLSRAKGKIGGVVYQQYQGMQISREYQPVVKNPQTTKQVENRAKFKMASQITAEYQEAILARLANVSIYTRSRRAASVNAIYKIITTSTPATPSALVNDVVAAINAKNPSGVSAGGITTGANEFVLLYDNNWTVIYSHCGYDSNGKLVFKQSETYTSDGTSKNVEYNGNHSEVIFVSAFRALTEAGRATIANTNFNDTNSSWMTSISRGVANGDIEISTMRGNVYIEA